MLCVGMSNIGSRVVVPSIYFCCLHIAWFAAHNCGILIDLEATHALMDHGHDDGDIEWLGLQCGARDDVVENFMSERVLPLAASQDLPDGYAGKDPSSGSFSVSWQPRSAH